MLSLEYKKHDNNKKKNLSQIIHCIEDTERGGRIGRGRIIGEDFKAPAAEDSWTTAKEPPQQKRVDEDRNQNENEESHPE